MKWRAGLICACMGLSGCHVDTRYDAAQDVRAFLMAARQHDTAEFEGLIDRAAVRADILRQIRERATLLRQQQLDEAVRILLRPQTFAIAVTGEPSGGELPSRATFTIALQWLEPGVVCLPPRPGADRCAITFKRQGNRWKLAGIRTATFLSLGIAVGKAQISPASADGKAATTAH